MLLAIAVLSGMIASVAYADTIESPNYKFDESTLGPGGIVPSSSANYQATQSVGDTAVGNSASGGSGHQINAGSITTADPSLTFTINDGSPTFGSFSATDTATATTTFSVSNYTSYGYIVAIIGDPPTNGGHVIPGLSTTGPSTVGEEQFGINLVKNADFCGTGCDLGADPDHGQFGYGGAATNYDTPGQFRFVSGETIAEAPKSSGITTYTISYMVNVKGLTPGGQYSSYQSLICVATY
ncbi:MAG TPA: hypothetical protein VFK11_04885 [Candidatus Saccharimonadales bacterium]|nr:hypothetical protein [Candidatus Saccharimonadales bacterium]